MSRCCIVGAGPFDREAFLRERAAGGEIIAVDAGLLSVLEAGCTPDVLLGDFDSLGYIPVQQDYPGASIEVHPRRKDATDFELALDYARERNWTQVSAFGVLGGRLDQTLATLQTAAGVCAQLDELVLYSSDAIVYVLSSEKAVELYPREDIAFVSVFSATDESRGVQIEGLSYPFSGTLMARGSLGVSNEFLPGVTARISVADGVLLVILQRRCPWR